MEMKEFVNSHIKWFAQGALRIEYDGNVIYIDPYRIDREYADADLILLSHSHDDHFSPTDIEKVIREDSTFVIPESMEDELDIYPANPIAVIYPFDVLNCDFCKITAVPAYNIVKTDCHPREKNWVGYILEFEEATLYYTSDTELIPEMEEIECDIILLPLGQTYTFESVEDAARAAALTNAELAVPIHWGLFEGTREDVAKFTEMLAGIVEVELL